MKNTGGAASNARARRGVGPSLRPRGSGRGAPAGAAASPPPPPLLPLLPLLLLLLVVALLAASMLGHGRSDRWRRAAASPPSSAPEQSSERPRRGSGGTCGGKPPTTGGSGGGGCGCSASDPVSDPAYNMREIVKQSILAEEHLAEPAKRCADCIVKHLLHMQALAEEALCLAGARAAQYPLLDVAPRFYGEVFREWLAARDRDPQTAWLPIQEKLRAMRKDIVQRYILTSASTPGGGAAEPGGGARAEAEWS